MRGRSQAEWWGVVLDAPDARELAAFYRRLLGWAVEQDEPGWMKLSAPGGGPGLAAVALDRRAGAPPPAGARGPSGFGCAHDR